MAKQLLGKSEGSSADNLKESNYCWYIPGGTIEVTYMHDKDFKKFAARNVKILGKECMYKFTPNVNNTGGKDNKDNGTLEIAYDNQTYILSYHRLPGKNADINWCLHLPKKK